MDSWERDKSAAEGCGEESVGETVDFGGEDRGGCLSYFGVGRVASVEGGEDRGAEVVTPGLGCAAES